MKSCRIFRSVTPSAFAAADPFRERGSLAWEHFCEAENMCCHFSQEPWNESIFIIFFF